MTEKISENKHKSSLGMAEEKKITELEYTSIEII